MTDRASVHLWWARADDVTDEHLTILDDRELERLARLRHRGARDRFALGVVLLRHVLAALEDTQPELVRLDRTCPRCGDQHGPVTAPETGWRCSVAHSGALAVVAVSDHPIGVDVEITCPPDWEDLLPRVLAPGEGRPVDAAAFLSTWVRKEAVVKATHEGLSRPLSTVDLAAPPAGLQVVDLLLDDTDLPEATAAIAVGGVRPEELRAVARRWPRPRRG